MKIDRKLNLVLTVEREDDGQPYYIHAVPIGRETFQRYFMTITRTYAAMVEEGGEWIARAGPRTAALLLERIARARGDWDGPEGVERGLVPEIRRLANVAICDPASGWTTLPLEDAIKAKLFSEDDAAVVESSITFFTVCCASMPRSEADGMMTTLFGLYNERLTSSNATEFLASLPTSTPDASTGAKATQSSMPR